MSILLKESKVLFLVAKILAQDPNHPLAVEALALLEGNSENAAIVNRAMQLKGQRNVKRNLGSVSGTDACGAGSGDDSGMAGGVLCGTVEETGRVHYLKKRRRVQRQRDEQSS